MESIFDKQELDQLLERLGSEEEELTTEEIAKFLDEKVNHFLKEKLEFLIRTERDAVVEEDNDEENTGNGYYPRELQTRFGKIEDLQVARDRKNNFQTQLFEPYQKRERWLEEMVIGLYTRGVSTRGIAEMLEKIYGGTYSRSTISRITDIALEEVAEWKSRPIESDYLVLYVDGFVVDLRRDSVSKEAIYLVSGVNTQGYREILGFYVGGNESATVWKEVLSDLRARGLERVLLVVSDDLAGLQEVLKEVFPKADVQPCMAHKVRNTIKKTRSDDQAEIAEDLKSIYRAPDREVAEKYLKAFAMKWETKYPRIVKKWRDQIDRVLTFMKYPKEIWSVIYTTNWIERTIKEFRKRLKPMNSIPTIEAAEKIVYLKSALMNRKWSERKLRGFKSAELGLKEMFVERYPACDKHKL